MSHGLIDAASVPIQTVLAEMLAMIGRYDDQGVLEQSAVLQPLEELPELVVEVGDAVVVRISRQRQIARGDMPLVETKPVAEQKIIVGRLRPATEMLAGVARRHI